MKKARLDPGGIEAISRWLSLSDTTGNNGMETPHPEGVTEGGREKRTVPSGIPAGIPSLYWGIFRGCRCAQSPANGFHPSGILLPFLPKTAPSLPLLKTFFTPSKSSGT